MIGRLLKPLLLPAALTALLIAGLYAATEFVAPQPAAPTPAATRAPPPRQEAAPVPAPAETEVKVEAAARSPRDSFAVPPYAREDTELVRVAPRPPLTPPAPESDGLEAGSTLLHKPVALSAGALSFSGRRLELEGIEPLPAERMCEDRAGGRWPCGMIARTAFRNYLRGRSLDCTVPDGNWRETVRAACLLAGEDIARWLVVNGWAAAAEGSPYADAARTARQEGRGMHGADPRR